MLPPARLVFLPLLCLSLSVLAGGCSSEPSSDIAPDSSPASDSAAEVSSSEGDVTTPPGDTRGAIDATDPGETPDTLDTPETEEPLPDTRAPETLDASGYCEAAVDVFCPYYIRCGRMAVADLAECQAVFVPACNARFEDEYAHLAELGLLELSAAGLDACAEHLTTVPCEQQVFDLDLGCGQVWTGLAPAGGACGPGIESFVCQDGTTCVLGLDFCGTCEPASDVGGPCNPGRCVPTAHCVSADDQPGVCQARPLPGQACTAGVPCVLGSSCLNDVCTARPWVGVGEACGQQAQCKYKSACVQGVCQALWLAGEACGANGGCAAGYCDGAICQPKVADGAACTANDECLSANCDGASCGERQPMCL